MAFPESNSSGSLQLHGKIYVPVSIRDPPLRLPGSAAPGSRDTETSSEPPVLGAFPRRSLPAVIPRHQPNPAQAAPRAEGHGGFPPPRPSWRPPSIAYLELGFSKVANLPLTPPADVC